MENNLDKLAERAEVEDHGGIGADGGCGDE